jgi:general secretion pathway protein D
VTVVESERAVMRVATTIPVQTLNRFSEGGTIQDIVSFQDLDVGITLAVTPRMNENGFVTLDVEPVVEEITGFTGPAENQRPITSKRTVRTMVRVQNNETVVIGGLVRETDISTKSKVFLLGDIPILGALFTHHKVEKQKTDLLIFITPRLIEPVAAN